MALIERMADWIGDRLPRGGAGGRPAPGPGLRGAGVGSATGRLTDFGV